MRRALISAAVLLTGLLTALLLVPGKPRADVVDTAERAPSLREPAQKAPTTKDPPTPARPEAPSRDRLPMGATKGQVEAGRLERELGSQHPGVRELEAGVERNADLVRDLELELEVSPIELPEVAKGSALVHGRVVGEGNRGVPGLRVSAEGGRGDRKRTLGQAETDASGYYALSIGAGELRVLAPSRGVHLVVRTAAGEVLWRKGDPVEVAPGERILVNVQLPREARSSKSSLRSIGTLTGR